MTNFFFKILILGLESNFISFYVSQALGSDGESKDSVVKWYKEINVFDDICNLDVNAITDVISADFDEIIPTLDGIIYFLNPVDKEQSEFFEMVLPTIQSVKRDIPIVLVYNDQSGILPVSVNDLLEDLWINHIDLEAFVNLPPGEFHQALQCLCLAIINGDTPLNIENAWMRFPIFVQLANIFFKQQHYYYAAKAIQKAAIIADIFNKEDFYIISEQAALLYSKVNLYLEASKILQNVDPRKSEDSKIKHVDNMITEGNRLFNKRKYETAAQQYLAAAQFSEIELNDRHLRNEAFRLAINSWLSALNFQNVFKVLDILPHGGRILLLREITNKIEEAGNFLIKNKRYLDARDQLYLAVSAYQKDDLFEELNKFTNKLHEVLVKLLEAQISTKSSYLAKQTYDEIENLWESYEVKKQDLDKLLLTLIDNFLEDNDFGSATTIINKLNSLTLKKKSSKQRDKAEDEYTQLRKKEIKENIQKGIKFLTDFSNYELTIITEINNFVLKEADKLVKVKAYLEAAQHLKAHADFINRLGKEEIHDQILTNALDILTKGKEFDDFFKVFNDLTEIAKSEYLSNSFQTIKKNLTGFKKEAVFQEVEKAYSFMNLIYRDQMLYEQSKEISELFIEAIKEQALKILDSTEGGTGVEIVLHLIKKATDVSSGYLDESELEFNQIYRKIIEFYISKGDLSSAYDINDRIKDKWLKAELHKTLTKAESEKRAIEIEKVETVYKEGELKDRHSIIQNKAREAFQDRVNELRQRRALKRAYFDRGLNYLVAQKYELAIEEYKKSIDRLLKIKKYNLAGVSLAVISLIYIKTNQRDEISKTLISIKTDMVNLGKFFSETFPITLLEYIVDVHRFSDENKFRETLVFIENLPFFKEELALLNEILGKTAKPEKTEKTQIKVEYLIERVNDRAKLIKKEKQDVARRKLMKNQYWKLGLEDLERNRLENAIIDYSESLSKLMERKFYKPAVVSLIIETMVLTKQKGIAIGKSELNKKLTKYKKFKSQFEDLPELKLFKEILNVFENNLPDLYELCISTLVEKLVLFDPEINFLQTFVPTSEKRGERPTREELGRLRQTQIRLDQEFAVLQQQLGDIRRDHENDLKKRNIMKKRLYTEVVDALSRGAYNEAGTFYFELAKSLAKRKDFKTSSLLILLHGLSLLKAEESLRKIRSNIDQFLDSIGLNKTLVINTFYIRIIIFIIDIIPLKTEQYFNRVFEMLELIPLLNEEKVLYEIKQLT